MAGKVSIKYKIPAYEMGIDMDAYGIQYIDGETYIEVDKQVAEVFDEFQRAKKTYFRNIRRNKAYYSLDGDSYVEKDALNQPQSADMAVMQKMDKQFLQEAIRALPEKQARRVHAYFFLGMSKAEIARNEGVYKSAVQKSIDYALRNLKIYFKRFDN